MKSLYKNCSNMFGSELSPDCVKALDDYFQEPTTDNWDRIYCIILGGTSTVWQAVISVDSTFPDRGRITDEHDNIVREWERTPDIFLLKKAINYAKQ